MTAKQKDVVDPYKHLNDVQNQRLKLTTDAPFTPTYVQQALTLSSDPAGIYESRVKDRHVLLENPARESKTKKERLAKQARKRAEKDQEKLRPLGRNAAEYKGLWKLEKHATRFELFVPLHHLWMGYMSELLGLGPGDPDALSSSHQDKMPNASSMHAKLVKADINGAFLTVRQSRNPCLVGLSGIVLHETENAFKLITRKNQLKLVPKQNSVFVLAVPLYSTLCPSGTEQDPAQTPDGQDSKPLWTVVDKPHIEFHLYGNQFCFRSADRSNRKFKAKETIEL